MVELIDLAEVAGGLSVGPHELISLAGAGGKTTILRALGLSLPGKVVLTTTTRMARQEVNALTAATGESSSPAIVWREIQGEKVLGLPPSTVDGLFDEADYVVVEADGARRRPFKAPGPLEPVIPGASTLVISVVGADALGRVIADDCHRPLRVAALAGCGPYDRLTPDRAARVLLHPQGGRHQVPAGARWMVAINKVTEQNVASVEELSDLLAPTARRVAIRWSSGSSKPDPAIPVPS